MTPQARVGLITLVAFGLMVATVIFLRGGTVFRARGYDVIVRFSNAGGIEAGAPVRVSGVSVGRVTRVELAPDNQAQLTLMVRSDVKIPRGSRFQVATTGILGDRYIGIIPGPADAEPLPPMSELQGEPPFTLEALAQRLESVARRAETLITDLDRLATDPGFRQSLQRSLQNAEEASAIARRAAANVEHTTARFRLIVDRDAAAIAADLRGMSRILTATAARLHEFVETTTGDGALSRDLRETVTSVREASRRVEQMAADLQGLINRENVGKAREALDEARETVREARETVRDARAVVQRAGSIVDRFSGPGPPGGLGRLGIPAIGSFYDVDYELWYSGRRVGHGLDVTLLPEAPRYYRLGVHDIGARNALVLQTGQWVGPSLGWRAGIYESEFGLGLDYRLLEPLLVSVDLYNVNQPTLDAAARYRVAPGWRITLGGKNLLRQPSLLVGLGKSF